MKNDSLGYLDYIKAAFSWRYPVPGLGHLPLNILALVGFGILGLGHPAFWLLGLAYEAGYLTFMAGSQRFQKIVQGRRLLEERSRWQARQTNLYDNLDRPSQERYNNFLNICRQIIKTTQGVSPGQTLDDLRNEGLSQLAWMFLKLLFTRIRTKAIIENVKSSELEEEIRRIEEQLKQEAPETAMHRSLQGTLEIQKRRLENLNRAGESLKFLEAELNRMEKQARLLSEEASISTDPEALTVRLDSVVQSLTGTNKWMAEHGELFGSLEEISMPQNILEPPLKQTEG